VDHGNGFIDSMDKSTDDAAFCAKR
jgi:hypothetical protein